MCFGVPVSYFYCLCFCWQLHFIIHRLNKDQVDSETREHCRIGFLWRNVLRKLSGLEVVFADVTDTFFYLLILYLFIIFQCHSVVFVDLNANFIKEKSLEWFNLVSFKCTLKGYFDILKLSVLCSFIRCPKMVCAFCPKATHTHTQCTAANRLARSQQYPLVSGWNANNAAEPLFD